MDTSRRVGLNFLTSRGKKALKKRDQEENRGFPLGSSIRFDEKGAEFDRIARLALRDEGRVAFPTRLRWSIPRDAPPCFAAACFVGDWVTADSVGEGLAPPA